MNVVWPGRKRVIKAPDFFLGVLAVLASRRRKTFVFNQSFEEAMAKTFKEFKDYAEENGVEVGFLIFLHPLHGDSMVIKHEMLNALYTGLISVEIPGNTVRIKMTDEDAMEELGRMTEGKLFLKFADRIIEIFSS